MNDRLNGIAERATRLLDVTTALSEASSVEEVVGRIAHDTQGPRMEHVLVYASGRLRRESRAIPA